MRRRLRRPTPQDAIQYVTLSGAASEAAQSKGPPIERCVSLREARVLSCGDLSTRSRTHSLKVTMRATLKVGQDPTSEPHRRQPRWLSLHRSRSSCSDGLPACRSVSILSRAPLHEV
jgi:hypothetical protein